ncbi:uncharacterized protein LOC100278970 isoform 2 [Zea mays]|uniref:uncharacterized protein LOC100278970 isoform 2 n=1 Tax=Zea mays TaxID=4577 RepID=UPI000CE554CA|nr:uncharacterized protein LOC100278970 isoform 2 [Zea mays]
MSSLVRSFGSLYSQKLRSTTRLGSATAAPPRFQALVRSGFSGSSHGGDVRRPPARPSQHQSQDKERTPFFILARLAVGSILAAAAPMLHSRWASFLLIQSEVDMVKDTAEVVAEAVEDAATVAEKVSSEVAEQLPENGRLRTAVVLLEHASKEVAEEAHLAQNIIHKSKQRASINNSRAAQVQLQLLRSTSGCLEHDGGGCHSAGDGDEADGGGRCGCALLRDGRGGRSQSGGSRRGHRVAKSRTGGARGWSVGGGGGRRRHRGRRGRGGHGGPGRRRRERGHLGWRRGWGALGRRGRGLRRGRDGKEGEESNEDGGDAGHRSHQVTVTSFLDCIVKKTWR